MDREAWTLRQFNRQRARFGEDLCSVISTAATTDEYGGSSHTTTTAASAIPCFYEPLSQREQVIAGAEIGTYTHRITMQATAVTLGIGREDQILVAARGDNPARTFENPTNQSGSYSPLAVYVASLRSI